MDILELYNKINHIAEKNPEQQLLEQLRIKLEQFKNKTGIDLEAKINVEKQYIDWNDKRTQRGFISPVATWLPGYKLSRKQLIAFAIWLLDNGYVEISWPAEIDLGDIAK